MMPRPGDLVLGERSVSGRDKQAVITAVQFVPSDGVTAHFEVDSDLMLSPRDGLCFDQATLSTPSAHREVCLCGELTGAHFEPDRAALIEPKGCIYCPLV